MELKTKLYLVDEQGAKFMGIGVLWLLRQVRQQNSLRKAASVLGLSYSKAFAMVRNLEEHLGVPVLDRRKGGAARYGATLTPFAERFIALYGDFEQDAKHRLDDPYGQFSEKLSRLLEETKASDEIHGGVQ
jgi:molybdate transport system regulatory protein